MTHHLVKMGFWFRLEKVMTVLSLCCMHDTHSVDVQMMVTWLTSTPDESALELFREMQQIRERYHCHPVLLPSFIKLAKGTPELLSWLCWPDYHGRLPVSLYYFECIYMRERAMVDPNCLIRTAGSQALGAVYGTSL